jgi:hypothetical protein
MAINNTNIQQSILNEKALTRSYLTKGFEEFRVELLDYARNYFPDKIQDFTEASVGGMLLDFAAIVGDSLSFYMDHQFNELNPNTAVERKNIENHIRRAGIKAAPASPSIAEVTFEIRVELITGTEDVNTNQLPKILKNLKLGSSRDIDFYLLEDVDFNKDYTIKFINSDVEIPYAVLQKKALAVSGNKETIVIDMTNAAAQFPTVTLPNRNITMIERVIDDLNNEYYEVEFLSQDTVYKSTIINEKGDKYYEILPAPYRFVKEDQLTSGLTILRFGSGNKDSIMQQNLIQDPTKSVLSLYGRDYFPKFSFDPGSLLNTNSLGIAPKGNLYITYSYGGGLNHNVPSFSINRITDFSFIVFNENTSELDVEFIINNMSVYNEKASVGGLNGLTFQQLQGQLNNAIKMQNRIVNYQDLLSKIYSMPSSFGKVSKIALEDDPNNIYAKNLYVLCFDENQKLTFANDVLKRNLSNYLNEFRLIGDSFNILDAKIYNIQVEVKIRIKDGLDPVFISNNVKARLQEFFIIKQFEINQPIILDELINIIINTNGVYSVASNKLNLIKQVKGTYTVGTIDEDRYPQGLKYSNENINLQQQIYKDVLYPTKGGIFELKFLDRDIIVQVVA